MFVLRLRRPGADLEASEGRCKNLLLVFLKRFSFPPNRHVIGAVLAGAVHSSSILEFTRGTGRQSWVLINTPGKRRPQLTSRWPRLDYGFWATGTGRACGLTGGAMCAGVRKVATVAVLSCAGGNTPGARAWALPAEERYWTTLWGDGSETGA